MYIPLKSQKLRFIFLSIFLGIFFGRELFFSQYIIFLGVIFLTTSIIFRQYILLVISLFLLGNFYGQYRHVRLFAGDILPQFYGQSLEVTGWVKNFPDMRKKNNRVFLHVVEIKKNGEIFQGKFLGNALLVYPPDRVIDYGDQLKILGKFQKPRNFDGFDYQKYLKRFGIQVILKNPENIDILSRETEGYMIIQWAKKFRNFLAQNLSNTLSSPQDQIAMGILLGVKKELPRKIAQNFKNSGLQHILVVSGFNVTVLMVFCAIVLKQFGRRIIFFGSVGMLFFFCLMVGGDPPVLRATIFGGIVGWAIVSGKFSDTRNLLFLTAVILAIISPPMIQQDVGFFLSFLATFGIVLALPMLQRILIFLPEKFEIRSILSVIIAAQISVFPILGLYFGIFPIMGVLANIFVEPLIPLGMGLAFATTIFYPILGENFILIFAFPAQIILSSVLFFADLFGQSEGILVPVIVSKIGLILVFTFFLWGSFSLKYQRQFLEES